MTNVMKITTSLLFYFIFLFFLLPLTWLLFGTNDIYTFFINNNVQFPFLLIIVISVFLVVPFYLKPIPYNIILVLIMNISVFADLFLHVSISNVDFANILLSLNIEISNVVLVLLINAVPMMFLSTLFLIKSFSGKQDKFYKIHGCFVFLYAVICFSWYASLHFDFTNPLRIFVDYRPYDFIYQIIILLRRDILIYLSFVVLFNYFNQMLFVDPKKNLIQMNKNVYPLLCWFLFGWLGLERLFLKTKYFLINIQVISTSLLFSCVFIDRIYSNSFLNMPFYIIMIIVIILKIMFWLYSLYTIITHIKNQSYAQLKNNYN